jgi:predicted aldo/keto reductase-like oxidoreductase
MSKSKLGFGFMRLPKQNNQFDISLITAMVDVYMQSGNDYFDTAYIYEGSEQMLSKVLVERYPRESYRIATKLPVYMISDTLSAEDIFNQSLSRLGIERVDNYLLHGIDTVWCDKADELGVWNFLRQLKSDKRAKSIGFSFHGKPEELDYILMRHPEVDFVQLQINYVDWESDDIQSKEQYEIARKHNKPIIVMEPVKGGLLAGDNSPVTAFLKTKNPNMSAASWAMRFVGGLEGVETVLSGMNSMEQMKDNIATLSESAPLTESEHKTLAEAIELLDHIPRVPCTGCGYCVDSCPKEIKIPQFIGFLNETIVYNSGVKAREMYELYTGDGFYASTCVKCRKCEERCPQKLNISDVIARVSDMFDNAKKILT